MTRQTSVIAALALLLLAFGARPSAATFHLMNIDQVIGGVDGDVSKQAIQIRYRSAFQNLLSNARIYCWDANGENPIGVIAFPSNIGPTASGTRVLIATAAFGSSLSPAVTPDFIATNPIPASYLAAGSLTFEDDFGTVYWRLSWGGASYFGDQSGDVTNDADGQFGVWPNPLNSTTNQALAFQFGLSGSTLNQNDYQVTGGAATFFNSSGASGSVQSNVDVPGFEIGTLALSPPMPNPVRASMTYALNLPRAAHARVGVYDLAGRRVLTLVDQELAAGPHSFSWAAGSLSGGVYFLGLESEGSLVAKRFVMLR